MLVPIHSLAGRRLLLRKSVFTSKPCPWAAFMKSQMSAGEGPEYGQKWPTPWKSTPGFLTGLGRTDDVGGMAVRLANSSSRTLYRINLYRSDGARPLNDLWAHVLVP